MEAGLVTEPDRDFLLRSLLDLEREHAAGDLSDDDYRELKSRYETKLTAASVSDERPQETVIRHRTGRTVLSVALVAAVAVGAGWGVAQWSGSREPGEQVSGSIPSTSAEQLAEAATLAGQGEVLEALKLYDAVLEENPEDVAALTYKGWLLRNVGAANEEPELAQRGVELIEQATQIDPTYSEAWFFRGIIFLRDEDEPERAADALKLALANDPIPEIDSAARELLAEIAQAS